MTHPLLREQPIIPASSTAQRVAHLYHDAFPADERVPHWLLTASGLLRPSCRYSAWYDGERLVGLTFSYTCNDIRLLLFFAVDEHMRSGGYGRRILSAITPPTAHGAVILQIEPPDEAAPNAAQRRRRMGFYERNGFRLVDFDSIERGQRYATMVRGRHVAQQEFLQVLQGLFKGTRKVEVADTARS